MSETTVDFELPNLGPGPDPLSIADLADTNDFAVLMLQRDHYCTNCRNQVQDVAARYDEFRDRGAVVVSVVPEPTDRVREWQSAYDLPYPIVADADTTLGDRFDQPVRYGRLGQLSDFFGRMPVVVIIDLRSNPDVAWIHRGRSTFDRPTIDDILAQLDALITA